MDLKFTRELTKIPNFSIFSDTEFWLTMTPLAFFTATGFVIMCSGIIYYLANKKHESKRVSAKIVHLFTAS